jgi:hypothetical protein
MSSYLPNIKKTNNIHNGIIKVFVHEFLSGLISKVSCHALLTKKNIYSQMSTISYYKLIIWVSRQQASVEKNIIQGK